MILMCPAGLAFPWCKILSEVLSTEGISDKRFFGIQHSSRLNLKTTQGVLASLDSYLLKRVALQEKETNLEHCHNVIAHLEAKIRGFEEAKAEAMVARDLSRSQALEVCY